MIGGNEALIAVPYDQFNDPEEWLASRRLGLGGNDAAAVMGEHPQRSEIDVFLEKTIGTDVVLSNERSEMGHILEPIVLDLFSNGPPMWPRSGGPYTVVKPPSVYHRDRTWQRGSADAFVFYEETTQVASGVELIRLKPPALGEVKTHGWYGSKAYDLDDTGNPLIAVPPEKRIQCAWYMALYDIDVTYLMCLIDTHLRRTFVLHRDRELEEMILERCDYFWRNNVLADVPPQPDGSESYRRYLHQRFKSDAHVELLPSTAEVDLATQALVAVKRDIKKLEKDKELAEQVIKQYIGDATGTHTSLGKVTWKSQPSGKLRDREARAELYQRLGMTDDEITSFEDRYKQPDHRVLRTPTIK